MKLEDRMEVDIFKWGREVVVAESDLLAKCRVGLGRWQGPDRKKSSETNSVTHKR